MIFLFLLIFLAVVCAILFVRALPYILVIGFIIWAVTAIHGATLAGDATQMTTVVPDQAMIPASDVLQLCGAHAIKDVVCDEARRLERKYHNPPCWETNKC